MVRSLRDLFVLSDAPRLRISSTTPEDEWIGGSVSLKGGQYDFNHVSNSRSEIRAESGRESDTNFEKKR